MKLASSTVPITSYTVPRAAPTTKAHKEFRTAADSISQQQPSSSQVETVSIITQSAEHGIEHKTNLVIPPYKLNQKNNKAYDQIYLRGNNEALK